jgi:two-component system LytT family response regulator
MQQNILIVDDEKLNREYIRDLVKEFEPNSFIFEAPSGKAAKSILESEDIDILFTDIKMPDMDGFELINSLEPRDFELVFITAYSEFAIKAINESATAYLLKPVNKFDFKDVLLKTIERRKTAINKKILSYNSSVQSESYLLNKLAINHQQGIKFIALKDIIYLKADNSYTTIVLNGGEKIISSKPINRFEAKLNPYWFFRVHKTYIINMFYFKEYVSKDGDIAVMTNGDKIYISRYRLGQFLSLIQQISGELKI